jgi:hypothetical protein
MGANKSKVKTITSSQVQQKRDETPIPATPHKTATGKVLRPVKEVKALITAPKKD